jgi:HD-GYP domain-containing protein (c-di-GMP phosphodiesterase class II)
VTTDTVHDHDRSLQAAGRRWVSALHAAHQTLRMYPSGNEGVERAMLEVARSAHALIDVEGYGQFVVKDGFFFVNDTRLRFDQGQYAVFSGVAKLLDRNGIGGLRIGGDVPPGAWMAVVSLLAEGPPAARPADWPRERFRAAWSDAPLEFIQALAAKAPAQGDEADSNDAVAHAKAQQAYNVASAVTRDALTDVRLGRAMGVRRIRRAVIALVDQVTHHEHSMLAMTQLRSYDEYTHQHSVNVCIFSLLIGRRLGLTKDQLLELGMGALLHDVGKVRVPGEVIRKPAKLDDEEWDAIRRHPLDGLLAIHQMAGFGAQPLRTMLMAYEHHMKVDLTGYPATRRDRRMLLLSKIVAAADCFDAGTARRSYTAHPPAPDEVIRELRDEARYGCDPLVVKALINVTGMYPVGTLVILDTYEVGIVARKNPDPTAPHRPIVKLITDPMGTQYVTPVVANLAEVDANGVHLRTIIKTSNAERYGIRAADYVAA